MIELVRIPEDDGAAALQLPVRRGGGGRAPEAASDADAPLLLRPLP
jgi:hypothetical protein